MTTTEPITDVWVEGVEQQAEQTQGLAENNSANITAMIQQMITQADRITELEAQLAIPDPGTEIDTGQNYLGRPVTRRQETQDTIGPVADATPVKIMDGVYEARFIQSMLHISEGGTLFWVPGPYLDGDAGFVGPYMDNAGAVFIVDQSTTAQVQNWRVLIEYTRP